jgi:Integrase core domain
MGRRLSMATREELLGVLRERYARAAPTERRRILDEFVAVSGYHRKHAIRLMGSSARARDRRGRSPVYDAAVQAALVVVWEASDRICGKRLKALLPVLVPAMERRGHLRLDDLVRHRLLAMSAATMDRLLRMVRERGSAGRRRPGVVSAVRRSVRVRTFSDWGEPPPGFMEMDLVAHSGPSMAGTFAWTLVLTDVASGWTECVGLPFRDGVLVVEALTRIRRLLPFALLGVDVDNDSVFLNEVVVGWCRHHGIEPTRARAYRKNDQAWVEQKNGAVVRRLVGHDRLEGVGAAGELGRLYASARLFVNFFQPSFKLASKQRDGAKFSRQYHAPATPYARLLASGKLEPEARERLAAEFAALDPIALLAAIRDAQQRIATLAALGGNADPPQADAAGWRASCQV